MSRWRTFLFRLRETFRSRRHNAEMGAEMQHHLELRIERNIANGMSPEEARLAALRAFGGVEQIKERARDERGLRWLESFGQDLRYGLRQLRKTPGFTAIAVLTLGIGVGANTATFSLVEEVVLKSLPVKQPEELVFLGSTGQVRANHPHWIQGNGGLSPVLVRELQERGAPLVDLCAFGRLEQMNAVIDDSAEVVPTVHIVTGNYFSTLGLSAEIGRLLGPEDDRPGGMPTTVISFRYWQNRFRGDPTVLGKSIWLNSVPLTIVGVAPAGFGGVGQVGQPAEIFVPLALAPRLKPDTIGRYNLNQSSFWWLWPIARLHPNVTPAIVRAQLDPIFRQSVLADFPETISQPHQPHLSVRQGDHGLGVPDEQRHSLFILTGMVGLVLVVTCVNLANLLLARGAARRREIAVRLALGASRWRVVRQLLTESLLFLSIGCGLALLFAQWGKDLLLTQHPLGYLELAPSFDGRVFIFTVAVALVTGVLFGLAPAIRVTRFDVKSEFNGGSGSASAARNRFASGLLVAQVALSFVLLVGAGMFVRTLRNLEAVDVGFNRHQVLLFTVDSASDDSTKAEATYRRLNEGLATLPGVLASTFSSVPLLSHELEIHGGSLQGERGLGAGGRRDLGGAINGVGPDFFQTFQFRLLRGRGFEPRDFDGNAKVAVLNESMAQRNFPNGDAVGQITNYGEIVGVVQDAKYSDLRRPLEPTVYVAYHRRPSNRQAHFALRFSGNPEVIAGLVRARLHDFDRTLPMFDVRTQDEQIDRLLEPERLYAWLAGCFSGLALLLAGIGLYGLLSYAVLQRTREIGVRMALGALPRWVVRMILKESLVLVGIGMFVGIGGGIMAVRLIATQLYGVNTLDVPSYATAVLFLLVVGLIAAVLPARRAAKVDPIVALRYE